MPIPSPPTHPGLLGSRNPGLEGLRGASDTSQATPLAQTPSKFNLGAPDVITGLSGLPPDHPHQVPGPVSGLLAALNPLKQ